MFLDNFVSAWRSEVHRPTYQFTGDLVDLILFEVSRVEILTHVSYNFMKK